MAMAPDAVCAALPAASAAQAPEKRPWPAGLPEQIKAVADLLAASPRPLRLAELALCFGTRGNGGRRLPVILATLEALGRARRDGAADAAAADAARWSTA
jgi:hypothetical protein